MKGKNHMIISIDAETALDKIQHPFMIKTQQSGNRGNKSKHNKGHIWQTHSQHHTQWVKRKTFPLRSGTRQGCLLSPLLFNTVLRVPATAIRQEEIKGIQIGKEEVKLSLFAGDMVLYIENPKESTKKLLELINEFRKIARCKINIQKSAAFSYATNKLTQREIKKTIPSRIASKRIKS